MDNSDLDAGRLAHEFDVSEAIMARFIDRFAPHRVAPDTHRAAADTMLFIHVPKTAGVSVGKSLREAFDQFHGVEWDNIPQSFRKITREALYIQTRGRKRQVIIGHFGWSQVQMWRNNEIPLKCGTIFRDPVARIVSNYNYNCSSAHPGREKFREKFPTLDAYAWQIPLDVQLTQAIGLIDSFETALTKFVRHYTFLGVTEHLSASLRHLGRSHGLSDLREYRENVGLASAPDVVSPELRTRIERRSHNDQKLHRLLSRLYAAAEVRDSAALAQK